MLHCQPLQAPVSQVWLAGPADSRLRRYFPGVGQAAPLRQAQHALRRSLRSLRLGLVLHEARSLPDMDIL